MEMETMDPAAQAASVNVGASIIIQFLPALLLIAVAVVLIVCIYRSKHRAITGGWIMSVFGAVIMIIGLSIYNYPSVDKYGYYKSIDLVRERGGLTAVIIGAVVLVFGILFIVLGHMDKNKKSNDNVQSFARCGKCGAMIPSYDVFCPVCGNNTGNNNRSHMQ